MDTPTETDEFALQRLLDRQAVIEVVTRVANHADAHEWELLRDCFTDEVEMDYTSLAGGKPSRVRVDDLIAGWRATLAGFDSTQHQVTNFLVTLSGNEARCQAYVRAHHYLKDAPGGDSWMVAGTYDYSLERLNGAWHVRATKLMLRRLEGNISLAEVARSHVARKGSRTEEAQGA